MVAAWQLMILAQRKMIISYLNNEDGGELFSTVCFTLKGSENMKSISIDLETFSSVSLQKSGVYRYAESDDFEILLFGYSVDGGKVKVIELAM